MTQELPADTVPSQTDASDREGTESSTPASRSDRLGVGGGDENVAKLQLAARWAEQFTPDADDSLEGMLERFKRAYHYVDSVTKLVEPEPA